MSKKYLIVIGGATASGKTGFAIALARHYQIPIISADSRQFYREMEIGTARPTEIERSLAKHYFVGHKSVTEPYSVGDYEEEVLALLEKIYEREEMAILVGGSGLYLKAACEGLDRFPPVPDEVKQEIQENYDKNGIEYLQQSLAQLDPDYYEEVDTNNPHRLMRALTVCKASGQPFSSFRTRQSSDRNFSPIYIQLQWPREHLYARINQRVDHMMAAGLEAEARSLYPFREHTALQTVGYQELFDYFEGKTTLEQAVELIKRNSRRYAKRQLTWYRRDGYWKLFRPDEYSSAIQYIEEIRQFAPEAKKGLIAYSTVEASVYQIHAEKELQLQIYGQIAVVHLFIRKEQVLAFPAQPDTFLKAQSKWILHELSLYNPDIPMYVFGSPSLAAAFAKESIETIEIPSSELPGWIRAAFQQYFNKRDNTSAYLIVSA
jgi:tRNA dimethylallyltransferase